MLGHFDFVFCERGLFDQVFLKSFNLPLLSVISFGVSETIIAICICLRFYLAYF